MNQQQVNVQLPGIPDREFSVTAYGAIGDGIYDNTAAFAKAIEACAAAGGGRVTIPAGIWLTGPIELRSRVELNTAKGALVTFSRDFDRYPLLKTSYEGLRTIRCTSPISGDGLEDVAITGQGIFDGGGDAWRPVKDWKMTKPQWQHLIESGGVLDAKGVMWWPTQAAMDGHRLVSELLASGNDSLEAFQPARDYLRPVLLSLRKCTRVLLDGPTFQNSPSWNLHPWLCEQLTIRNVTVRNPWFAQNGDGLDVESCVDVHVHDTIFDVGDDAICIKSGKNEDGRKLGKPCRNVWIHDCHVYHGHGGFVIGSEMSGGVRDVWVSDCTFDGTDVGLRFKSTRGRGGVVENIHVNNIRMNNIEKEAIVFQLYYETGASEQSLPPQPVTEETPQFRDIHIKNTICVGAETGLEIRGLPEMPVQNITFENVQLSGKRGIRCTDASGIRFRNVTVRAENGPAVDVRSSTDVDTSGILEA